MSQRLARKVSPILKKIPCFWEKCGLLCYWSDGRNYVMGIQTNVCQINTVFAKAYRTWRAHRGSTSRYHSALRAHFSGHVKIYLTYNFISDWLKRCTGKFTRESVQFFDRLQKDSRDEIQRRSSKKIETTPSGGWRK